MNRIIAHVDMDCFFCACELKKDPTLKGKPVAVGATGERGVISTANYEARKYGLHSALPISIARQRCPQAIYLPPDFNTYKQDSEHVMTILSEFDENLVQVSIDEAYLDLTQFSKYFSNLKKMAEYILIKIKNETGLTCSIGISECRKTAKIASDFNKPNGYTIVENKQSFLSPLDISKIPGVGKKSKLYYYKSGVKTIGDLIKMDRFKILNLFGEYGVRIVQMALGEIDYDIPQYHERKSISKERTFHKDSEPDVVKIKLNELCYKIHSSLKGRNFKKVSIKLRYEDFSTITRDFSLSAPNNSAEIIQDKAIQLFNKNIDDSKKVRLIGVKVSDFLYGEHQTTLLAY